jgi:fructokinase
MAAPQAPSAPPVLVIGEAVVDIVDRTAIEPGAPVVRHFGGSPANVAVGLARLGYSVRLATQFGPDHSGDLIGRRLYHEGITLAAGTLIEEATPTAQATLDSTGAAQYSFQIDWDLPPVELLDAGHVHTGSIAATLNPGAKNVAAALHAARSAGLTTSYDPNVRPQIMGPADDERPVIESLIAASDVVKASDEDLAWLYPGEPAAEVLTRWLASGPSLVVITRGEGGALAAVASAPTAHRAIAHRPVAVVDTVGAGDAFMSGLLSGLLDAGLLGGPAAKSALQAATVDQAQPALERAAWTASITCGRAGAQPPRRSELSPQ